MDDLYIVVELQRTGDQVTNIVTDYTSQSNAYYNFHYASAFAAISSVDKHAVSLLNGSGGLIERSIFIHSDDDFDIIPSKYIVVEYQINEGQAGKIVTAHDTLLDAQYKFHTVAASAAISNIETHLVVALNDDGFPIEYALFHHKENE